MPPLEIKLTMPELPATISAFKAEPALRLEVINDTLRACGKILRAAIKDETPVGVTGKLRANTYARLRNEGGDQQLAITQTAKSEAGVSYGWFVREGTRPHFPPIAAVAPWARAKGIPPFLVARAIAKHGTKANHYPERAYEKVAGQIDDTVAQINQMTAERLAGGK